MSTEAVGAVLRSSKLKGSELLVLVVIAHFADPSGRAAMTMADIQSCAKLSQRGTQRAVKGIEQAGEIQVFKREGPIVGYNGQRCNAFQIAIMPPAPERTQGAAAPASSAVAQPQSAPGEETKEQALSDNSGTIARLHWMIGRLVMEVDDRDGEIGALRRKLGSVWEEVRGPSE